MAFELAWTSTALPAQNLAERQEAMPIDSRRESVQASKQLPHLFPCPEDPEEIDPLNLYQACRGVLTELYGNSKVYAEHYWVPEDALIAMVTDWLVSIRMGVDPFPATFFIPEKGNASGSSKDSVLSPFRRAASGT